MQMHRTSSPPCEGGLGGGDILQPALPSLLDFPSPGQREVNSGERGVSTPR
jgi:hypothetical protein